MVQVPLNLFLSLLNFEEKEIEFLKEPFCEKLPSNDDNNWATVTKRLPKQSRKNSVSYKRNNTSVIDKRIYCK